jgi:hypothetical protein
LRELIAADLAELQNPPEVGYVRLAGGWMDGLFKRLIT